MAFSSTIKATLGLDTSLFASGLRQAQSMAGEAGKAIHRKLGAGDAFKGFVAAFGISVETIAEKIAEAIVGGTRKGFEQAAQIAEQNAKTISDRLFESRTDDQKRTSLNLDMQQARREMAEPRRLDEKEDAFLLRKEKAQARLLEAQGKLADLEKRVASDAEKRQREQVRTQKEIAEARKDYYDSVMAQAEDEESLDKKAANRDRQAAEIREAAARETGRTQYDMLKKAVDLEREAAKLRKDSAEAQAKADEERKRNLEQINAASRQQLDDLFELLDRATQARASVEASKADLAQAVRDQSSASLGELVAGTRGTSTDRAQARAVARLRARAERVRDMGGDYRDAAGNRVDAADYADSLSRRANTIQEGISGLSSSERDPLAVYKKALEQSEAYLKRIRDNLEPQSTKS